jgi:hypothetical protein
LLALRRSGRSFGSSLTGLWSLRPS